MISYITQLLALIIMILLMSLSQAALDDEEFGDSEAPSMGPSSVMTGDGMLGDDMSIQESVPVSVPVPAPVVQKIVPTVAVTAPTAAAVSVKAAVTATVKATGATASSSSAPAVSAVPAVVATSTSTSSAPSVVVTIPPTAVVQSKYRYILFLILSPINFHLYFLLSSVFTSSYR